MNIALFVLLLIPPPLLQTTNEECRKQVTFCSRDTKCRPIYPYPGLPLCYDLLTRPDEGLERNRTTRCGYKFFGLIQCGAWFSDWFWCSQTIPLKNGIEE
jgi:hypothetical protein